jgi:hypothetical protein
VYRIPLIVLELSPQVVNSTGRFNKVERSGRGVVEVGVEVDVEVGGAGEGEGAFERVGGGCLEVLSFGVDDLLLLDIAHG